MIGFFQGFSLPVILVALGFAIIPSAFWILFYLRRSQVPLKRALITFFAGMLSVFPVLLIDHFWNVNGQIYTLLSGATLIALVSSIWVGISEEYSKHLSTELSDGENTGDFDQIIDGMTYSIMAALGFALVENIKFFLIGFERYGFLTTSFVILFIFRMIGSTLAHTLFSGIYGYYYGKAKFTRFDKKKHPEYTRRNNFLVGGLKLRWARLKHFLGIKHFDHDFRLHVRQEEILAEGLIIATVIHAMFDFALTMHHAILIVPMLFIEYTIIIHEFNRKQNREVYVTSGKRHDDEHMQNYENGYKIDNEHLNKAHHIGHHSF